MASEVVTQAINETIVSNGKRGITAESLANVLHLMNEQGGGGAGSLEIKMGIPVDTGSDMITSTLTAEERANNQEVFRKVRDAVQNGEAMPIVTVDMTSMLLSAGTEADLYLDAYRLNMGPIIYGYMSGSIFVSELGASEFVLCYSILAVALLLEDGTVIVAN